MNQIFIYNLWNFHQKDIEYYLISIYHKDLCKVIPFKVGKFLPQEEHLFAEPQVVPSNFLLSYKLLNFFLLSCQKEISFKYIYIEFILV